MYSICNTFSECTYFYISKKINSYTFLLVLKLLKAFSVSLIRKVRWKDCSRVLHFLGKIKIRGMLLKQYLNLAWMILKLRNNLLPMLSRLIGMVACSIKDCKNNNRRNKLKRIMAFVTKFVQQWKKKLIVIPWTMMLSVKLLMEADERIVQVVHGGKFFLNCNLKHSIVFPRRH